MNRDSPTDNRGKYGGAFILSEAPISQVAAVRRTVVPLDELAEHSSRFSEYTLN